MKKGVNKVILLGNLGNDPEIKNTNNGGMIATFSLATSETWKDKNTGESKNKTEWHRVVLFGKLAEIAAQYLKKGSQVYFEGKLQTNKWKDQSGQDRYTTEVIVDSFDGAMQMLGANNQSTPQNETNSDIANNRNKRNDTYTTNGLKNNDNSVPFDDDLGGEEIPF